MKKEISFENKNLTDLIPIFAGYEDCDKGHFFGPTIRQCYLIHYVTTGYGIFTVDNKTYELEAGDIFIIKPQELTYYKADEKKPWSYVWIGFNGSRACRINELDKPVVKVNASFVPDIFKMSGNSEYTVSMLFLLFSELFGDKAGHNKYVRQMADYITYNYMKDLSVEGISKIVNLDRRYASRLFKKEYGIPISSFLINTRMKHAKDYLENGYNVEQSAKMAGYNDTFNFSKMFKKLYGKSPGHYKS